MCILVIVATGLALWAIFVIRYLRRIIYVDQAYLLDEKLDIPEEFKPFVRNDRRNWKIWLIYLGAVFLFPVRFCTAIFTTVQLALFAKLLGLSKKADSIQAVPAWKLAAFRLNARITSKIILLCLGFLWITKRRCRIKDYLPDYPYEKEDPKIKPHILVANHVTYFDIFVLTASRFCPSFIAKQSIEKVPLYSSIANAL